GGFLLARPYHLAQDLEHRRRVSDLELSHPDVLEDALHVQLVPLAEPPARDFQMKGGAGERGREVVPELPKQLDGRPVATPVERKLKRRDDFLRRGRWARNVAQRTARAGRGGVLNAARHASSSSSE